MKLERSRMRIDALMPAIWIASMMPSMSLWAQMTPAPMKPIALASHITHVQPMTGIVLWDDSDKVKTDAIQLEYSYMKYGDIVHEKGKYDWAAVEKKLAAIASRRHQAVLRFYDVYVAKETTVPAYIKALPDYHETHAKSEGKMTGFSDWSHPELRRFILEFYSKLADKYDRDPRLAFLETGFGLWAEYHIYDGPMKLGQTFPDKAYQAEFLKQMAANFKTTPWLISVDAADTDRAPIVDDRKLLALDFGVFDDSFLCKQHAKENEPNWNALDRERYRRAPAGGEFSYYNKNDQKMALAPNGPNGVSCEAAFKAFHITFMIGNDQPEYQAMDRIRAAGMASGYRFRVESFQSAAKSSTVTIANIGVAPIYYEAFPTVNGVRSATSLKGLLPGERRECPIVAGGDAPKLTIESDRLVKEQAIEYEAELK